MRVPTKELWILGAALVTASTHAQDNGPRLFLTPDLIDIRGSNATAMDFDRLNLVMRGSHFTGGFGSFRDETGRDSSYGGGYFRPFGNNQSRDLRIGLNYENANGVGRSEFQAEYINGNGLGYGAGYLKGIETRDIYFGKLIYRKKVGAWNLLLSPQWQTNPQTSDAGGYVVINNDRFFFSGGRDGEESRGVIRAITKKREDALFHSVGEVMYVDESAGRRDGVNLLFVNASLGYSGGFFSHSAGVGRAMGPSGIRFENPFSTLSLAWNRAMDVWEIGQIANARFTQLVFLNGQELEIFETVAFPTQFMGDSGWASGVFVGYQRSGFKLESSEFHDSNGAMLGYKKRFGGVLLMARFLHNFGLNTNELVLRLNYFFDK